MPGRFYSTQVPDMHVSRARVYMLGRFMGECTSVFAIWTEARCTVQYGKIPILGGQNLHQLTRTRGRTAACFGGFRTDARARRAMDMTMRAHGEGP